MSRWRRPRGELIRRIPTRRVQARWWEERAPSIERLRQMNRHDGAAPEAIGDAQPPAVPWDQLRRVTEFSITQWKRSITNCQRGSGIHIYDADLPQGPERL